MVLRPVGDLQLVDPTVQHIVIDNVIMYQQGIFFDQLTMDDIQFVRLAYLFVNDACHPVGVWIRSPRWIQ